jgi:hypothetical protein
VSHFFVGEDTGDEVLCAGGIGGRKAVDGKEGVVVSGSGA